MYGFLKNKIISNSLARHINIQDRFNGCFVDNPASLNVIINMQQFVQLD